MATKASQALEVQDPHKNEMTMVKELMEVETFIKLLADSNYLLMNIKQLEYFGILNLGVNKVVMDRDSMTSAFDGELPSIGFTNGTTITYLATSMLTLSELNFLTIHELLHIISLHAQRRGLRDPKLWNLACDHVDNRTIKSIEERCSQIKVLESSVYFDKIERDHPGCSAEEVYTILLKDLESPRGKYIQSISEQTIEGQGSGDGTSSGGKKYKIVEVVDKDGRKMVASDSTDDSSQSPAEQEEAKARADELIERGRMIWNSELTQKGDMPGDLVQYLNQILKIELPWHKIFENAILYLVQNNQSRTWGESNFYLRKFCKSPGKKSSIDLGNLILALDSSGSISDRDIEIFAGIISSSSEFFKQIHVLIHDVDVHDRYVYDKGQADEETLKRTFKVTGRGGTSHVPVFNEIEKMFENDDKISMVIFLTDFCSDIEHNYNRYEWFKYSPVVWCITNNNSNNLRDDGPLMSDTDRKFIHIRKTA